MATFAPDPMVEVAETRPVLDATEPARTVDVEGLPAIAVDVRDILD